MTPQDVQGRRLPRAVIVYKCLADGGRFEYDDRVWGMGGNGGVGVVAETSAGDVVFDAGLSMDGFWAFCERLPEECVVQLAASVALRGAR